MMSVPRLIAYAMYGSHFIDRLVNAGMQRAALSRERQSNQRTNVVVSFKRSFRGVVGQGAGYEHRADGQQAGGMQNFSEGGGMQGGNLGSGMPVGGMGSGMQSGGMEGAGQGEHRHHHPQGGQQGGGMQVLHPRLTFCSAQACL